MTFANISVFNWLKESLKIFSTNSCNLKQVISGWLTVFKNSNEMITIIVKFSFYDTYMLFIYIMVIGLNGVQFGQ